MTCGPYRAITLKAYTASIAEVHTRAYATRYISSHGSLVPSLKLDVTLDLDSALAMAKSLSITLKDLGGSVIKTEVVSLNGNVGTSLLVKDVIHWELAQDGVKLWWPVGYGEQNLYNLEVILLGPVSSSHDRATPLKSTDLPVSNHFRMGRSLTLMLNA